MGILLDIDRQLLLWLNGSDSLFMDGVMATLTAGTTWIPLYLALFYMVLKNNDGIQKVLLILASAGLCVFFAGSLNDMFVKTAVERWRPTHDGEIAMLVDVVNVLTKPSKNNESLPLNHSSNSLSYCMIWSHIVSASDFLYL